MTQGSGRGRDWPDRRVQIVDVTAGKRREDRGEFFWRASADKCLVLTGPVEVVG